MELLYRIRCFFNDLSNKGHREHSGLYRNRLAHSTTGYEFAVPLPAAGDFAEPAGKVKTVRYPSFGLLSILMEP